jgi:hypothetical protein
MFENRQYYICGATPYSQGSIGRTDFPGGSYQQLIQMIKEKLLCYEDDVICYPATDRPPPLALKKKTTPSCKTIGKRVRGLAPDTFVLEAKR